MANASQDRNQMAQQLRQRADLEHLQEILQVRPANYPPIRRVQFYLKARIPAPPRVRAPRSHNINIHINISDTIAF